MAVGVAVGGECLAVCMLVVSGIGCDRHDV